MAISQIAALAAVGLGGFLLAVSLGLWLSRSNPAGRDRLRLDLFDRRWRVYANVVNSISRALDNEAVSQTEMREFNRGVAGNEFLFQQDVAEFVDELARQLTQLLIDGEAKIDETAAPQTTDGAQRRAFALRWLELNEVRVRALFAPYLDLGSSQLSKR